AELGSPFGSVYPLCVKDDWVLIYEGGGWGHLSLLALPVAIASLFGVVLCFGNLLELAGLLRLPPYLELEFSKSSIGQAWTEGTVTFAYCLLLAGVASCFLAWKTLDGLWKYILCSFSPLVVYQGFLSHLRIEYPGRAPEAHGRSKSAVTYWRLSAGEKTW